jgi:hypothetical protein
MFTKMFTNMFKTVRIATVVSLFALITLALTTTVAQHAPELPPSNVQTAVSPVTGSQSKVFGFRDFKEIYQIDEKFLAVPDP